MSRRFLLCFLLLITGNAVNAQTPSKLQVGIEQDVLPYVTGGYFAGAWVGKSHLRLRALTARVHKPDFVVKDGFTDNKVTAYAILGDYFVKENWTGWWVGSGLVYWKSSIREKSSSQSAVFHNYLLNGSMGYNWPLSRHLYMGPWAGLHLRVGGAKKIAVGAINYEPPLLNPEASLKVGWIF